ncbi:DUF3322 domain-containing protein [Simplicispira psychrophila]|uniref:DUF3322 domain-containing protein n=1 Tax=Simplicispira psychrophila TaxID=80882 RepID=UPI000A044395
MPNPGAWPLLLDIGAPSSQSFRDAGPALRQHLQAWKAVTADGPGRVQWAPRSYRRGASCWSKTNAACTSCSSCVCPSRCRTPWPF